MPIFALRNRTQILRDMVARVVARSPLGGLTRNSAIYHVLAAATNEDAEQYVQLARLRLLFSIDSATGSDLDERAAEIQPGVIQRRLALYAYGLVTFSRPGIVGSVVIPAGTLVSASDAQGPITYRTTASATILVGDTSVANVPVTAQIAGSRGNVSAGSIVRFVTRITGVTLVTNAADITTGVDRESDADFRARLKLYIQALSRGTPTALISFARNVILSDGRRVLFAHLFEPSIPNGQVQLYIDDGTGAVESFSSEFIGSPDVFLPVAVGGEVRLFTTDKPIRDDGSFVFRINGVDQVRNIEYTLNPASGQITLDPGVYPAGLTGGDVAEAEYRYYTGLIAAVQRVIDGDPSNPLLYPGVRAAGIAVFVLPPQTVFQSLTAGITVSSDFDASVVRGAVRDALQAYINGLDIGDDVIVAKVIEVAMDVSGMEDFRLTLLTGSAPPANQIILDHQVARIISASITLV